jgi:hypothetical protein
MQITATLIDGTKKPTIEFECLLTPALFAACLIVNSYRECNILHWISLCFNEYFLGFPIRRGSALFSAEPYKRIRFLNKYMGVY